MVNNTKTPYELWKGRPTTIKHFKVFGRKLCIKINEYDIGNIDSIFDEGFFLGYAYRSEGYKFYKKITWKVFECIDVRIDDAFPRTQPQPNIYQEAWKEENHNEEHDGEQEEEGEPLHPKTPYKYV